MSGIVAQNVGRNSGLVKAAAGGAVEWTLIKTLTASSSATLSFVNGASDVVLDDTYDEYYFNFIDIHAGTNNAQFFFNGSDDTSSHAYDISKTTTFWRPYKAEAGDFVGISYDASFDHANGTGFQALQGDGVGIDNDQSASGHMRLFNPASTTFVTHFFSVCNGMSPDDYLKVNHVSGYFNTTAAITAIQFKFNSGNIDAGTISLYGIGW